MLRPPLPQRTPALRAVDDERPPESDAEAERIAEMRARMEAMFGGGEAPAPEPPAAEAPAAEAPGPNKEELAADAEIAKLKAELKALRGDPLPPADYGTTQV